MNQEQMNLISALGMETSLNLSFLKGQANRTLVYGYDQDRNTRHVYLKDGHVHNLRYTSDGLLINQFSHPVEGPGSEISTARTFVPEKRTYPGRSDFDFCMAVAKACGGSYVFSFTQSDNDVADATFSGRTIEDCKGSLAEFEAMHVVVPTDIIAHLTSVLEPLDQYLSDESSEQLMHRGLDLLHAAVRSAVRSEVLGASAETAKVRGRWVLNAIEAMLKTYDSALSYVGLWDKKVVLTGAQNSDLQSAMLNSIEDYVTKYSSNN